MVTICLFTWTAPWSSYWGYFIGSSLGLMAVIGMLLIHFQKLRRAISAGERQFRLLAENAQDLIYRFWLIPEFKIEYISPSPIILNSNTPESFYSDPQLLFKIIHPDDQELLKSVVSSPNENSEPIVLRWMRTDGRVVWAEHRNVPIFDEKGNFVAIEGIARDITERKEAEDTLRESQERYRCLVELSPNGIVVHSEGNIVYINAAGLRLLGMKSADEIIGRPILDFVHPDYRDVAKRRISQMKQGVSVGVIEEKFLRVDGEVIDVEVAASPVVHQGRPAMQVVIRDITDRKKVQEEIEFKSLLLDSATDSVFVHDQSGRFVYVNEVAYKSRGYTKEELLLYITRRSNCP